MNFSQCLCLITHKIHDYVLPQIFSTRSHNLHLDKLQGTLNIVQGVSKKRIDLEIMKNDFVTLLGKKK